MKDNNYVVACKGRKKEANFWQMKANKYTDLLEEADENAHYKKQQVMKLEQEIEKCSDYKEGCQGKRARYNALTEETSMNTSNNKQASTVRATPNYSQVLQAPAPTNIQMDVDWERNGAGQFPSLPKPQLPRTTMASTVTIPHGANWMSAKEIRPYKAEPGAT